MAVRAPTALQGLCKPLAQYEPLFMAFLRSQILGKTIRGSRQNIGKGSVRRYPSVSRMES